MRDGEGLAEENAELSKKRTLVEPMIMAADLAAGGTRAGALNAAGFERWQR